jgi:hypothetical protein
LLLAIGPAMIERLLSEVRIVVCWLDRGLPLTARCGALNELTIAWRREKLAGVMRSRANRTTSPGAARRTVRSLSNTDLSCEQTVGFVVGKGMSNERRR